MDCKTRFDRRVLDSREGEVTFRKGLLVQVYKNDLAKTIGTEHKLMPMWSEPRRVTEQMLNSYKLETLDGQPLDGEYHARRLREFIPREGTELAAQQKEVKARIEEINKDMEEDVGEHEGMDDENNNLKELTQLNEGREASVDSETEDQQGCLQEGGAGWNRGIGYRLDKHVTT